MTPIPVPVRGRILQLHERCKSTREIAQWFGFCVAAVRRVRQQFQQCGALEPRTHRRGRRTLLTEERKRRIEELLYTVIYQPFSRDRPLPGCVSPRLLLHCSIALKGGFHARTTNRPASGRLH